MQTTARFIKLARNAAARLLPVRLRNGAPGKIGKLTSIEMVVWADHHCAPETGESWPDGTTTRGSPVPWQPFVPARVNGWQYFWDTAEGIITEWVVITPTRCNGNGTTILVRLNSRRR
jgi:hypothetical protein